MFVGLLRSSLVFGRGFALAAACLGAAIPSSAQSPRPGATANRGAAPAWIAKARAAEYLLQQDNGVQQALAAYERLDQEIPNQPAIILRTAQLADQADSTALALFHYRRYLQLAGSRARQEARERAGTLELNPSDREGADRITRERKVSAKPVSTPELRSSSAIMAALGDDANSLIEIKGPEQLQELIDPQRRAAMAASLAAKATPSPTASTAEDEALIRSFAARTGQPAAAPIRPPQAAADAPSLNRVRVTEGSASPRPALNDPSFQPIEGIDGGGLLPPAPRAPTPWESNQTAAGSDVTALDATNDPQLPVAYRMGRPQEDAAESQPNVRRSRSGAMVSDAGGQRTNQRSASNFDDGPPQYQPNLPQPVRPGRDGEFTNSTAPQLEPAELATPRPTIAPPLDPRVRFFTARASNDGKTMLKLANNIQDSIVTFSAISESDSAKVDSIIATGENRSISLGAGAYEVRVTIYSQGYPPSTLLDRRFRMRFNAGTEYTMRVSPELLQRLN